MVKIAYNVHIIHSLRNIDMLTLTLNKQQYFLAANILLALFIAFIIIYSLTEWYSDWQLTQHEKIAIISPSFKDNTAAMINSLPDKHIFGQSLTDGSVPITNLQLRVTGIVAIENSNDHQTSKAYISMGEQASKVYRIGDTLGYGVKIYDITSDAVFLENDGHIEKLPLPRSKLTFKPLVKNYL